MKSRINVSLDPDTIERIKQFAWEQHKTVSQVITDWVWDKKVCRVENAQIRGQVSLDLDTEKPKKRD